MDLDELLNPQNPEYLKAHKAKPIEEQAEGIDEDALDLSPVKLRSFQDTAKLRQDIHSKVIDSISKAYPKENDRYALRLDDVALEDRNYTLFEQKKAIQTGKSLTNKIKGTWSLVDKTTNKPVDRVQATVANMPYLTERGTFIRNGAESSVMNQMRLKPGVYTRQKASGEMEAHVNVKQGTGSSFKLILDPATAIFKVKAGQTNWKLYPLLNAMGVTDEQLAESWGEEVLNANRDATDPRVVQKAYDKLVSNRVKKQIGEDPTFEQIGLALKDAFQSSEVDPHVMEATLGRRTTGLDMDTIRRASQKVLNISRGTEETDSRDSLAYQTFMSPDDLFAERFKKDSGKIGSALLWKATYAGNLSKMKPGVLNDHFESLFNGSGLSQNLEEINPMDMTDQNERVVILGEGGIGDTSMIPDEAREVQSSHFMFIDPVRSPESLKIGVDSRFTRGAMKGSDGNLYTRVIDNKTGKGKYITPYIASKSVVAFPGEMEKGGKYVTAMINGTKVASVPKSKVNYYGGSMQDMFSTSSNMTPMMSGIKGGRLLMAGKFASQALPLRDAETPLVQSAVEGIDGQSIEDKLGDKLGVVRSKKPGKVLSVDADSIKVKYADGTTDDINLYNNFNFNRKTYIHNTPTVKPGDAFDEKKILATSNYTDKNGTAALGKNLRVAYMSYKGINYDDGQVISESAAKKLSSEHMYSHSADRIKGVEFGKHKYAALFPKKFNREQLSFIDDNGIIKEGSIVKPGDPLILSTTATRPVNSLLRDNRKTYNTDSAITWDHSDEGVVTDVYDARGGVNVVVKAYSPVQIGDKLSGRHADKGVVGAIIPDDQMPRDKDGNAFEMLASPLGIVSRVNPAQVVEAQLGKVADKTGKKYVMPAYMSEDYIDFAKNELAKAGLQQHEDIEDPISGRTIPKVFTGKRFIMKLHHTAEAKQSARSQDAYTSEGMPAKGGKTGAKRFCFAPKQKIKTIGGEMDISAIVEKKLATFVWSYDWKESVFCYKPVTDWFTRRVAVKDVIQLDLLGIPSDSDSFNHLHRSMYVTKEHALYKVDGQTVAAGDVKTGDQLATWGPLLNGAHRSILLGSMLGDGGLLFPATASTSVYQEEHSGKQKNYIKWKSEILSGYGACLRESRKTYKGEPYVSQVYSISYPHITKELEELCIGRTGRKQVTKKWLDNLDDLAVAVWLLDDGWIGNRAKKKGQVHLAGNISTNGFTPNEVELLSAWLTDRYEKTKPDTCGAIYLTAACCKKLADVVAANIPWSAIPPSKKWLQRYCQKAQAKRFTPPSSKVELGCVPCWVEGVYQYKHDKPGISEINVYDLTVDDTHVYTASGVLVSNSNMEIGALISHGATEVLRDAKVTRGQRNDQFWTDFKLGKNPAPAGVPFIYNKFLDSLKAAGIQTTKSNDAVNIFAMTNKQVDELAHNEIRSSDTLDQKERRPISGGLFDIPSTGGLDGNKWGYIQLDEPIPNPVMEDPLRSILKMTKKDFYSVISGETPFRGRTGGHALEEMLKSINVDKELAESRQAITNSSVSARDGHVKRYKALKAMKANDVHPTDFLMKKIPVLPPAYRPISSMPDGTNLVADANYLYGDLIESRNDLRELGKNLSNKDIAAERFKVYEAYKAVTGVGDPVGAESQKSNVKGILKGVFGSSPKLGAFQRRVLGMSLDMVGRGVIVPDPKLNMDQVGMPINQAWELYKPFIIRDLVRRGTPATMANKAVENKDPMAFKSLERVVTERPVLINRAPTLHKYGLMAAWPQLVSGDVLRVSPSTTVGFNADFDGDQQIGKIIFKIQREKLGFYLDFNIGYDDTTQSITKNYFEERVMPAYFRQKIHINPDEQAYCVDLADFPRGKLLKQTKGQFGIIDWYEVPRGVHVLSLDEKSNELTWAQPTVWSVHHDCPVEIVTLSSKRQIFTDDDPRGVYGVKVGTLEFTRMTPSDALANGMLVPRCITGDNLRDDSDSIKTINGAVFNNLENITSVRKMLKDDIELTPNFGYMIGAIVGDGWVTHHKGKSKGTINIAALNQEIAAKVYLGLKEIHVSRDEFPAYVSKGNGSSYGESISYRMESSVFARFLDLHIGHGAANKHLPAWVGAAPYECRSAMFAGLIDTDGSISLTKLKERVNGQLICNYSTISFRLAREVTLLAWSLGIRATITATASTTSGTKAWVVSFSSVDMKKWLGVEYLQSPHKKHNLINSLVDASSPSAVSSMIIPISFELADFICKTVGMTKVKSNRKEGQASIYTAFHSAKKRGYITRQAVNNLLNYPAIDKIMEHPEWDKWLMFINDVRFTWDTVEAIEKTENVETGYDLTVPDFENFMNTDGVILSNTMQYHVPVSEKAVKEAIDKMMPSKNLLDIADFRPHMLPRMEFLQGLNLASVAKNKRPKRTFTDIQSAIKAYNRGEVSLGDNVEIINNKPKTL